MADAGKIYGYSIPGSLKAKDFVLIDNGLIASIPAISEEDIIFENFIQGDAGSSWSASIDTYPEWMMKGDLTITADMVIPEGSQSETEVSFENFKLHLTAGTNKAQNLDIIIKAGTLKDLNAFQKMTENTAVEMLPIFKEEGIENPTVGDFMSEFQDILIMYMHTCLYFIDWESLGYQTSQNNDDDAPNNDT